MEITRPERNRIRVALGAKELKDRKLRYGELHPDSQKTRQLIWTVWQTVQSTMKVESDDLRAEVYPDCTGGCVLYYFLTPAEKTVFGIGRCIGTEHLENLNQLSAMICSVYPKPPTSSLYQTEGKYHLVFAEETVLPRLLLEEFGVLEESAFPGAFLAEHGVCVIPEQAVEKLAMLAV